MDINPNLPAFNAGATLSSLISLSVAFVLGTIIGLERQLRQRTAGLRTNTLVAVGAAGFVDLAVRLPEPYRGPPAPPPGGGFVVSRVGLLGGRRVIKEGGPGARPDTPGPPWGA